MLNLNTPNKQWNMYLNTLSSISGDDLTIKPDTRRNLLLEVSGNNNIFIKKGDVSYNLSNLIIGDVSFSNVDVSVNLNPLTNNNGSLGSFNKLWNNAYIRDISATNISISGNMTISGTISNVIQIIPRLANDISLGTNTNTWQQAFIRDLSNISTINGTSWPLTGGPTGATGATGATGPTGPAGPTGALGVSINATLTDISNFRITTNRRIYQEISGDISWNAVNGYYGLAKDAYPSLNPLSSGVKAVMNWTFFLTLGVANINSICWSPELGIFVGVASNQTRITTSINGTIWIPITPPVYLPMTGVCWSSERLIFVAVSYNTNIVLTSINGTTWIQRTAHAGNWTGICWSPELSIFVAVAPDGVNKIMTSTNGIDWFLTTIQDASWLANDWLAKICWSAELGMFAIVNTGNAAVLTSTNGINWTVRTISNLSVWGGADICWSKELGIFVAVGGEDKGIISNDGINWRVTEIYASNDVTRGVIWAPQLKLFIALRFIGRRLLISNNGINWTERIITTETYFHTSCWSPELGIFVAAGNAGVIYSSLKGRPPTSYNVFDSSFNRIDENGKWDFSNINVTTLTVSNGPPISSDDRLKHNEVVINNGLDIIDKLTPKFYQKTQVLLDASYNGDLSNYAWNYEAGLIAQELLQIPDLSFTVGGGDYYEQKYNLIKQTNDLSKANYHLSNSNYDLSNFYYDLSNANYDLSNANYEVSYNLIAQHYNVNYNSVFVYGLAAIKELHAKVKAKETSILNRQAIINSLITRIEALESNNNV